MYSEAGKEMPYLLYNGLASDKSKRVETQTLTLWAEKERGKT